MIKNNSHKENFGPYIRKLRKELNIGQRDLAKKIGIAPSYLNDIEKEKRSAPKPEIIEKISKNLKVDLNYLNDLAGVSKNQIAPDINQYIKNNESIISLIRSIKNNNLKNAKDIYFYTDSHNDIKLLEFSTVPIAVDPDNILKKISIENNWNIISLR